MTTSNHEHQPWEWQPNRCTTCGHRFGPGTRETRTHTVGCWVAEVLCRFLARREGRRQA